MRLSLRLALPFFGVAIAVTALGTAGASWIVRRTFDAGLEQEGRQLGGIGEGALADEARPLNDAAAVMAFVDGPIRHRLAAWNKVPLDAAGIVRRETGAVVSWTGDTADPADLAGLRNAATGSPVLLRGEKGLLIAGMAPDRNRRDIVVAARRLGVPFAASLSRLVKAGVVLSASGQSISDLEGVNQQTAIPVSHELETPGGETVKLTVFLPGEGLLAARRRALALTLAGGLALLAAGAAFYLYMLMRVTRPLRDLISATDRIAGGDHAAALPADAPAELGDLVRKFNAMGTALRDAQERLVRSAKLSSVGALVAGISHELNNPLSILLSHAEYQETQVPPGAPGRAELGVVLEQGRRMQKILADLRGLVRPGDEPRQPVDLNAVARETLALVRHDATKASVDCEILLTPGELVVSASPDAVRQIVLNLALNALQAMPGGGRLAVSTGLSSVTGKRLARLSVADTGTGIAPEHLPRVTEPFFSTKPGRMGLGLAICDDLARRHGGTISIESVHGRGTIVTFEVPV